MLLCDERWHEEIRVAATGRAVGDATQCEARPSRGKLASQEDTEIAGHSLERLQADHGHRCGRDEDHSGNERRQANRTHRRCSPFSIDARGVWTAGIAAGLRRREDFVTR